MYNYAQVRFHSQKGTPHLHPEPAADHHPASLNRSGNPESHLCPRTVDHLKLKRLKCQIPKSEWVNREPLEQMCSKLTNDWSQMYVKFNDLGLNLISKINRMFKSQYMLIWWHTAIQSLLPMANWEQKLSGFIIIRPKSLFSPDMCSTTGKCRKVRCDFHFLTRFIVMVEVSRAINSIKSDKGKTGVLLNFMKKSIGSRIIMQLYAWISHFFEVWWVVFFKWFLFR